MEEDLKFIINNKVEISWNDGYYKSNIENVEEGSISISIPIKDGQYIPLRKFEQVEVIYYQGNNIYKFYTKVIDRQIDRIPIIVLGYPTEVFKVQRRKFVRVPIICTIEYSKIEKQPQSILKAFMVDLSGGGMRMRVKLDEGVALKNLIKAYIPVGEEHLEVKGEIVRLEKDEVNKDYICGVNFIDVNDKIREKLIKFIFQVMRNQMKNGTRS